MAAIYNYENGNAIREGLQGCNACDEAIQMAESIADEREESVELLDDDGRWEVFPAAGGKRRKARYIGEVVDDGAEE
jgi:hypothetical protein